MITLASHFLPTPFQPTNTPWKIPSRHDRVKYLISSLVSTGKAYHIVENEQLQVRISKEGVRIIPLWPTKESVEIANRHAAAGQEIIEITVDEIRNKLIPDMYEDEFIALFPNDQEEFEWVDVDILLALIHSYELNEKITNGTATEKDRATLVAYFGLRQTESNNN